MIIGAAIGFLLSFFSGLLGGVPFGEILLRALIWAAILGALAAGVTVLIKGQLPELFEPTAEPPDPFEKEEGRAVDITLPEEKPELSDLSPAELADESFVKEVEESHYEGGPESPEDVLPHRALREEVPEVFSAKPNRAEGAKKSSASAAKAVPEDDDVLPELGNFMESFGGASEPSGIPEDDLPSVGGRAKTVVFEGNEHDPAILARAVKTAMKKDQEG